MFKHDVGAGEVYGGSVEFIDMLAALAIRGQEGNYTGRCLEAFDTLNPTSEVNTIPEKGSEAWHVQLATPVDLALENVPNMERALCMSDAMRRDKIATLRDVLVIGRTTLLAETLHAADETHVEFMIKGQLGDTVAWHGRPSIEEIAVLCRSLDEVDVRVLGNPFDPVVRSTIFGKSVAWAASQSHFQLGVALQYRLRNDRNYPEMEKGRELRRRAELFKATFDTFLQSNNIDK